LIFNIADIMRCPENWTGDNIHFERGYEKMGRKRQYSPKFKVEVALEAIKGDKTISQIASEYGIHPQQVRAWKKEWVEYYNSERPHQSLGYKTPDEVYYGEVIERAS